MTTQEKLQQAMVDLDRALSFEKEALKDRFYYGGIAKAFELAMEYSWKYLKAEALDAGLEANSPRDAIKQAGVLGIIKDVEKWLKFLRIRNIAVHDYLGVSQEDYLNAAREFLVELKKLKIKTR